MKKIKEEKQKEILTSISDGNSSLRDEYILYLGRNIKKHLERYNIPEEYHDDLIQECMLTVISLLENNELDSKLTISITVRNKLFATIIKYLSKELTYQRTIDGKVITHPRMYLYLLHGYAPNYQETLKELIQYGKKTEYAYFEDRTSDEYMEEVLTSHMIEEAYIDFVSHQNKSYQQIILGRIPVLGNGVERTAKIAKEINCTRSYVSREANKCKRLLFNDAKIQSLLSEETKRTRKLK